MSTYPHVRNITVRVYRRRTNECSASAARVCAPPVLWDGITISRWISDDIHILIIGVYTHVGFKTIVDDDNNTGMAVSRVFNDKTLSKSSGNIRTYCRVFGRVKTYCFGLLYKTNAMNIWINQTWFENVFKTFKTITEKKNLKIHFICLEIIINTRLLLFIYFFFFL